MRRAFPASLIRFMRPKVQEPRYKTLGIEASSNISAAGARNPLRSETSRSVGEEAKQMMNVHDQRRQTFGLLGGVLLSQLKASAAAQTDSDVQGRASEIHFRDWLNKQLPQRFRALSGTVLSALQPPCTQRDCVIFDDGECAAFRQSGGESDMFPVEGVIAAIEINTGTSGTRVAKLSKDCEKLTEVGRLMLGAAPTRSRPIKLLPLEVNGFQTFTQNHSARQQAFRHFMGLYLFIETFN